jgi:hypothetical protein
LGLQQACYNRVKAFPKVGIIRARYYQIRQLLAGCPQHFAGAELGNREVQFDIPIVDRPH